MTAAAEIRPYKQQQQPQFGGSRAPVSQATAIEQSRAIAEVQAAVVVAQNCPRDMAEAEREMEYVCGRLDMAEQAFYQVTNRGTGPSVHLARELARIWGNIDYGVKELHRDDQQGVSEVLAFAWDVQKNSRSSRTFINPHQRMKQGNRVELTDLQDIYLSNQNVGARAVRETIFTILPRWFSEKAQNICRRTLEHGEGKPLADRIVSLVNAFGDFGVTEKQLEAHLEKPRAEWGPEHVAQLTVAGQSIRRGEARADDLFPKVEAATSTADEIAAAPKTTSKPAAKDEASTKDAESGAATEVTQQQETRDGAGDTNEVETQVEDTTADPAPGAAPDADPGQGGGNDQSQGATPSSGAPNHADSGDQDAPPKNRHRQAIESRLFGLIGAINPKLSDDDRIDLYRAIIGRRGIKSTNNLNNNEVTKIADQLFQWQQDGVLDAKVEDLLKEADARAAAETEGTN